MFKKRAAVALAAMTLLAACGGGDDSGSNSASAPTEGSGELTSVSVGVIPIVDVAAIYVGVDQGFFEDEGLDVELVTAQGGAAIVPAVVSGDQQFGFSNFTSLLLAESKGLPLQVVAPGAGSTGEDGADMGGVLVKGDSTIQSAADLEGKTVAVNTLNNINDTTVRASVREDGGDPSSVKFVELAFPDMGAALQSGQVDAIQVVEPFLTINEQAGARLIASNYVDAADDLTIAGYFTSTQYAQENPEVVEAFARAMTKSAEFAGENPDAVREILPSYTSIDPAVIGELTLPNFPAEVNRDSVETLVELGTEDGLFESEPDVDALLK